MGMCKEYCPKQETNFSDKNKLLRIFLGKANYDKYTAKGNQK
jgi:hypothetical protein